MRSRALLRRAAPATAAPQGASFAGLPAGGAFLLLCRLKISVLFRLAQERSGRIVRGVQRGPTGMVKSHTVGIDYMALRKECLHAVWQWPGCESIAGIQILRDKRSGSFSIKITLYGTADVRSADRAMACLGRLHRPGRRREGEFRRRPEPWQGIGRKFEDPLSGRSGRRSTRAQGSVPRPPAG